MAEKNSNTTPLEIHVTGKSAISRHAERCILSIAVTSSGEAQETVSAEVTTTANRLSKLFKDLAIKTDSGLPAPDAPVTALSIGSLHTNSYISKDNNNNPLPRCYTASVMFSVTFQDFQKLGELGPQLLMMPHVEVRSTAWTLTDATREQLGTESRQTALSDAVRKAKDYAIVLGRRVGVVEVRDDGNSHATGRTMQTARGARYYAGSTSGGIALEPEDVVVSVEISVKFVAVD